MGEKLRYEEMSPQEAAKERRNKVSTIVGGLESFSRKYSNFSVQAGVSAYQRFLSEGKSDEEFLEKSHTNKEWFPVVKALAELDEEALKDQLKED